jgi:hypothetical protein
LNGFDALARQADTLFRQVDAGGDGAAADPVDEVGAGADADLQQTASACTVEPRKRRNVRLGRIALALDRIEIRTPIRSGNAARAARLSIPIRSDRVLEAVDNAALRAAQDNMRSGRRAMSGFRDPGCL